jgi:hypothetical protein
VEVVEHLGHIVGGADESSIGVQLRDPFGDALDLVDDDLNPTRWQALQRLHGRLGRALHHRDGLELDTLLEHERHHAFGVTGDDCMQSALFDAHLAPQGGEHAHQLVLPRCPKPRHHREHALSGQGPTHRVCLLGWNAVARQHDRDRHEPFGGIEGWSVHHAGHAAERPRIHDLSLSDQSAR